MYFLDEHFLAIVPAVVAAYWLAPHALRNAVLMVASVLWLGWFSLPTLAALAGLTVFLVYPIARIAGAVRATAPVRANRIGWVGIIGLLAIATALRVKTTLLPDLELALPGGDQLLRWIGFSYFLLKAIHVMRGSARGLINAPRLVALVHYALFIPTLTSGPIYRLDAFTAQLEAPKRFTWDHLQHGLLRAGRGIAKKVVVVPFFSTAVALTWQHGASGKAPAFVLLYAMLYLDFSGYCDIAIGLGQLLGFEVPENFKNPFTATTLTQFWRNWHATLGDWVRENVFIPLGGLRAKGPKLAAIVVGSMVIVGLWHAYTLTFVMWGAYHGTLMLVENWLDVKPLRLHKTTWWQRGIRYAIVQALVIGGMFAFLGWTS